MKIAVSSWSLNKKFLYEGMTMPDFIRFVKEELGCDAIEAVNWMVSPLTQKQKDYFATAISIWENPSLSEADSKKASESFGMGITEISQSAPEGLDEIKDALERYGVTLLNMPIDCGNISQLNAESRGADLSLIKKWIDIAAEIGSLGARVNTGHQPEGIFDLKITADSYRELAAYAQSKGMYMILENHGGMSADPCNITELFKLTNHPNFRICPDFGNFAASIRYAALDKIFNNPVLVHAKSISFDETGAHADFDYNKCMEIAQKHGYDGYYSVEFEGPGDQVAGVRNTIKLLSRYA